MADNSSETATWQDHPYSRLCDVCASLFTGKRRDKGLGTESEESFRQTFAELKESAARKECHLCLIRWKCFTPQEVEDLEGCAQVSFGFWSNDAGMNFDYYYPRPSPDRQGYLSKSILYRSQDDFNWPEPDLVHRLEAQSQSATTFNMIRRWLHECEGTHQKCKLESSMASHLPLPTRLLDVRDNWTVRLVAGNRIVSSRRYTTLSHCWGGKTPLKLTNDSVDRFKLGVQRDDLPATFKDAIDITKKLRVNYLWIDSLCIVQDDDDDKGREIAAMERIYAGSYCNIAATKSRNSESGCFTQRHLMDVRPCKIRTEWRSKPSRTIYCWAPGFWDQGVEASHLLSRGWVIQERVLATRVLHFAVDQVFWECLEHRACETFPGGIPNRQTKPSLNPYSLRNDLIRYNDPASQRYAAWSRILDAYTRCNLTFPRQDKLVAISGLARKIGPGSEYVAGLWLDSLPLQLLWTATKETPGVREWTYGAPSWSWASIDGPIFSRSPKGDGAPPFSVLIDVLEINVELADQNPYGRVEGGFLRVKGPIGSFTVEYSRFQTATRIWMNNSLANVIADTEPQFERGSTITCLVIERDDSDGSLFGIVIKATGLGRGQYLRCGWFAFFNRSGTTESSRLGLDGYGPLREPLHSDYYEQQAEFDDALGFNNYVITLI